MLINLKSFISGFELIPSAGNDDAGRNIILDATSTQLLFYVFRQFHSLPRFSSIHFTRHKKSSLSHFSDQTSK
jgi:hypothetical protein